MKIPIYQIDAFADHLFSGNPAAVCPLEKWLTDKQMQLIAAENNLSETAFFVAENSGYHIRWFTPGGEVDLCGHATLASAYVLFNELGYSPSVIDFQSKSGKLSVERKGKLLILDFPAQPPTICEAPGALLAAFNHQPCQILSSEDYILVFERETQLTDLVINFELLKTLDLRGVAVTAPADKYDFVARFFCPKYAINEDPVTGSMFTQLTPYWANRLNKQQLSAKQISSRGGEISCELVQERVKIAGKAIKYLVGEIELAD